MKGAPWMCTHFYDEPHLTEPAKWAAVRRRCTSLNQTLHAAPMVPGQLPPRATFFDTDEAFLAGTYDGRLPIADEHVR